MPPGRLVEHDSALVSLNNPDAILRVTSYHRRDLDRAVITADPGQHDHVRESLFSILGPCDGSRLGSLQCLPLELISSICLQLDMRSALAFSQANRRSREVTASIHQYCQLRTHALDCMWAMFRIGIAPLFCIATLYSILSTDRCVRCDSFGDFIFLPTASRFCFDCIEAAATTKVLLMRSLLASGVPWATLKKYKTPQFMLRSIPGIYSWDSMQCQWREYLISGCDALEVLRKSEYEDPESTLRMLPSSSHYGCMVSTLLPYVDSRTGASARGRSCKGCQIALETCMNGESFRRRDRIYSEDEFLVHFQDCEEAMQLWLSSKGGTVVVEEPEFTRLGGLRK